MSVITKPIDEITVADLEDLCARGARETAELEFKGKLPFKQQKGQPETEDRWVTRGDRVGEMARDEIISELVSFANAQGGTLVLGLHETREEPKRAERLVPLPMCEDLARRLVDMCEDVVDPRMPLVLGRGIPVGEDGSGYVVLRVGASGAGPHRLTTDGQFYIRRGERVTKMTAREIKDLTLALARTGDRVEGIFDERHRRFRDEYELAVRKRAPEWIRFFRMSAFPVMPLSISELTNRQQLWWRGGAFQYRRNNQDHLISYPSRNFEGIPHVGLRQLTDRTNALPGFRRCLRDDGLCELAFGVINDLPQGKVVSSIPLPLDWIIGALVGTVGQVEHLRRGLALEGSEFGLELEICSNYQVVPVWSESGYALLEPLTVKDLQLPRLSVRARDTFDDLLTTLLRDIWNAFGMGYTGGVTVDWETALAHRG